MCIRDRVALWAPCDAKIPGVPVATRSRLETCPWRSLTALFTSCSLITVQLSTPPSELQTSAGGSGSPE
eukprot:8592195-Alexandrium_andersonii.AAC.1